MFTQTHTRIYNECILFNKSFRDYVLISVVVNGSPFAEARLSLRGYTQRSTRSHTTLLSHQHRQFGHTPGWYERCWPGRLSLNLEMDGEPSLLHKYNHLSFNCHEPRRLLKDVFDPESDLYSHIYPDAGKGDDLALFGGGKDEYLVMLRSDVHQCTSSDHKVIQRWPGMLILTNLRLIFLAYRSRSELDLIKRFEKVDDEDSGVGRVSYEALLASIKADLPKLVDRMQIRREKFELGGATSTEQSTRRVVSAPSSIAASTDANAPYADRANELVSLVGRLFRSLDVDGNGLLSLGEFLFAIDRNVIDHDAQCFGGGESAAARRTFELALGCMQQVSYTPCDRDWLSDYSARLRSIVAVEIVGHEVRQGGTTYYEVAIRGESDDLNVPLRTTWTVWHRFSEFEHLHSLLVPSLSSTSKTEAALPKLPPKFKNIFGAIDVAERQKGLNIFLQQVCRVEAAWTEDLLNFLDPPISANDSHENFESLLQEHESGTKERTPMQYRPTGSLDSPGLSRHDRMSSPMPTTPMSPTYPSPMAPSSPMPTVAAAPKMDMVSPGSITGDDDEMDMLSLLTNSNVVDTESRADRPQRLRVMTADGREFYFRVGHSSIGSLHASRRGCDGSLGSASWCRKFSDEIKWLTREDEFALSTARAYQSWVDEKKEAASADGSGGAEAEAALGSGRHSGDICSAPLILAHVDSAHAAAIEHAQGKKPAQTMPVWCAMHENEQWEMIETYPRTLVFPHDVTTEQVRAATTQRSKGRVASLTYLHRSNGAPICRCAQPQGRGVLHHDDMMLQSIFKSTPPHYGKTLNVVDARSFIAAQANAIFKGKGSENLSRLGSEYFINFMNIENIHTMRTSLDALSAAIAKDDDDRYMTAVDSTDWVHHTVQLLKGAVFVARNISRGNAVVVHCSDGWDRTSQLCALGQVLLDPWCRTLDGFAQLIDKDFGSFGHGYDMRTVCPTPSSFPEVYLETDVFDSLHTFVNLLRLSSSPNNHSPHFTPPFLIGTHGEKCLGTIARFLSVP